MQNGAVVFGGRGTHIHASTPAGEISYTHARSGGGVTTAKTRFNARTGRLPPNVPQRRNKSVSSPSGTTNPVIRMVAAAVPGKPADFAVRADEVTGMKFAPLTLHALRAATGVESGTKEFTTLRLHCGLIRSVRHPTGLCRTCTG